MFAVLKRFSDEELVKALRLFVSWSVRFLVVGGRGGLLDSNYGMKAEAVSSGKIKTAKSLMESMQATVPTNAEFEAQFSDARVSQNFLARYYLRALERFKKENQDPEWIPNDDKDVINLEHVLPEAPGPGWEDISPDLQIAYYKKLGNMVLLRAKKNVAIGNKSFAEKKATLLDSGYILTKEVGEKDCWGIKEISERQKRLAKLAVETWSLSV